MLKLAIEKGWLWGCYARITSAKGQVQMQYYICCKKAKRRFQIMSDVVEVQILKTFKKR